MCSLNHSLILSFLHTTMHTFSLVLLCFSVSHTISQQLESNVGYKIIKKVYDQCSSEKEILKCFKIQALKVADRALHSKSLRIMDGVTIIADEREGRSFKRVWQLNETKLQKLDEEEIDNLLSATVMRFLDTHKINLSVPKLLEEGRGKKKNKGDNQGALIWALAVKGTFLAMAYKGIAIMAGTALIVGKMALVISAILGLKKLVSHKPEKTTVEIVKHPHYSESHTHSTSYEDEGHYRRAWDPVEVDRQEKVFRAYVRK